MTNKRKDVFFEAVCELGASKLFLWAILLELFSFLLSIINKAVSFSESLEVAVNEGKTTAFIFTNVYEFFSIIVTAITAILLLRAHISFKRNTPNTKPLKYIITCALISLIFSVVYFAGLLMFGGGMFVDFFAFTIIILPLILVIAIISLFVFLAERKTIKLAIAFLEQDIAGILKYKASILLFVFIIFTVIDNIMKALSSIGVATLLSLPALAALIIYAVLLFKFRIIANTGTKKANKQSERKIKRIDL